MEQISTPLSEVEGGGRGARMVVLGNRINLALSAKLSKFMSWDILCKLVFKLDELLFSFC